MGNVVHDQTVRLAEPCQRDVGDVFHVEDDPDVLGRGLRDGDLDREVIALGDAFGGGAQGDVFQIDDQHGRIGRALLGERDRLCEVQHQTASGPRLRNTKPGDCDGFGLVLFGPGRRQIVQSKMGRLEMPGQGLWHGTGGRRSGQYQG